MEAILFIGIQATGKSSFYKERFFRSHVRISLDQVRTRNRERTLVGACLRTGQPFVVDNTNPRRQDRDRYIQSARDSGFRVVGYYFQSEIKAALQRNSERDDADRIPDKGVLGTYGQLEVPRIDGRSFTRLTRELQDFEAPYDERFRDCMVAAVRRLLECGFGVVYGYTQSDEISLLFRRDELTFGRKLRKYNSILAGEASATFTHELGAPAAFDCRISQLPTEKDVVDYFRWRQEDAHRNALSGHCYWLLRGQGMSDREATRQLDGTSVAARNELLFENGINFNELPSWQKRGIGLYWETFEKPGRNPKTGEEVTATRRRVKVDIELPMKEAYGEFVRDMVRRAQPAFADVTQAEGRPS